MAYSVDEREQILRAYQERSSLRGLQRTLGVARNTVTAWIKKVADLLAFTAFLKLGWQRLHTAVSWYDYKRSMARRAVTAYLC